MDIPLGIAAAVAFTIFILHTFLGRLESVVPLLKAKDIEPITKYLHYYCWHLVTMTLLMMAACFLWSALPDRAPDAAWVASILGIGFGIWGMVLPRSVGMTYMQMPQGFLTGAIGIAGLVALWL
jgi:uncharacterized BrkB/YihY/UPF0761 family membrane protein